MRQLSEYFNDPRSLTGSMTKKKLIVRGMRNRRSIVIVLEGSGGSLLPIYVCLCVLGGLCWFFT